MKPIIAIDPGPVESAILIWSGSSVLFSEILPNDDVLAMLRGLAPQSSSLPRGASCENKFGGLVPEVQSKEGQANSFRVFIACEMIQSFGMAVGQEVFHTCLTIGRIQEIADLIGATLRLVYRKDIKMHLCGSLKAKDGNIRQALIDKHGDVGTKKNPGPLYGIKSHLWSALAVADYALEQHFNNHP